MKYIKYGSNPTVAILINNNSLDKNQIENAYVTQGNLVNSIVAFGLDYGSSSKPSASLRKEHLAKIIPVINKLGITHILCCDAEYFKTLTGQVKAVPFLGSLLPSKIGNYEHILVTYCPSYKTLFRAPDTIKSIQLATNSINTSLTGSYQPLGTNIMHYESYPESILDIENTLNSLHQYDALTCDIETFSLKFYDAGIVSIAFAWNQHEGIAFHCDDLLTKKQNKAVRLLLFNFFTNYKGKLIFHNISYDATVLIYQLWMNSLIDQEGLLDGLECMTSNFDCTKVISYLATNSCARVKTGLKDQAFEFAGNWAEEEIKDIAIMEPSEILKYNLADTLATWFTYNKNHPIMVNDNQEDIYINLMKPAIIDIIQMQLTGFCLDMPKVLEVEKQLSDSHSQLYNTLCKLHIVNTFISDEIQQEVIKRNAKYKKKVIDASEAKFVFNPNSYIQIAKVLYEYLNLPVLDYTKKGNPAVGAKTLKKLSDITTDTEVKTFLTSLIDYTQVGKILSSFIPAFKAAPLAPDGHHYLFGSFNLGGTVSGRLSSSNPNLQNIPSGSTYGKLIKECFIAPKGWLFCGADSASLEDRIDTLLTKDPNKIKVYSEGYDGHSLRAYYYFNDQLADIPNTVEGINSIKDLFPHLRQDSKAPTFALTYQGTAYTLVKNCGFTQELAEQIEKNYHELYKVSDQWKQAKIQQASLDGYVDVAFGLKIRCPVLPQVILGNKYTPKEAAAESRTIGNALGQSYGLLNSRASMAIMRTVRASEFRLDIKLCAQIHDAIYFRVKNNIRAIHFLNELISKEMSWQELPELQHPDVKLYGELDIFTPNWSKAITLPNNITKKEILSIAGK